MKDLRTASRAVVVKSVCESSVFRLIIYGSFEARQKLDRNAGRVGAAQHTKVQVLAGWHTARGSVGCGRPLARRTVSQLDGMEARVAAGLGLLSTAFFLASASLGAGQAILVTALLAASWWLMVFEPKDEIVQAALTSSIGSRKRVVSSGEPELIYHFLKVLQGLQRQDQAHEKLALWGQLLLHGVAVAEPVTPPCPSWKWSHVNYACCKATCNRLVIADTAS